jgi:hypothetical protein
MKLKGFKAFNKGLVCQGKQYAENTVFEENGAVICKNGMHFCKNPLDTLDYYPLIDDNGDLSEFAEVESLADTVTDDNKKFATKKLHIGAKLDLRGFIKASIDFLFENNKADKGNDSQLAASGYYSKLVASGNDSQLAASGNGSMIALNGNDSVGAAIGYNNTIKGKRGCWITLAEYDYKGKIVCVKSAKIDGENIKADTWYKLKNGEFTVASEEESR